MKKKSVSIRGIPRFATTHTKARKETLKAELSNVCFRMDDRRSQFRYATKHNTSLYRLAMSKERKRYFLVMILLVDGLRSPCGDHTKNFYNVIVQVPVATPISRNILAQPQNFPKFSEKSPNIVESGHSDIIGRNHLHPHEVTSQKAFLCPIRTFFDKIHDSFFLRPCFSLIHR